MREGEQPMGECSAARADAAAAAGDGGTKITSSCGPSAPHPHLRSFQSRSEPAVVAQRDELLQLLLQPSLTPSDQQRASELVDALTHARVPFKEALLGGGPWVVREIYTRPISSQAGMMTRTAVTARSLLLAGYCRPAVVTRRQTGVVHSWAPAAVARDVCARPAPQPQQRGVTGLRPDAAGGGQPGRVRFRAGVHHGIRDVCAYGKTGKQSGESSVAVVAMRSKELQVPQSRRECSFDLLLTAQLQPE